MTWLDCKLIILDVEIIVHAIECVLSRLTSLLHSTVVLRLKLCCFVYIDWKDLQFNDYWPGWDKRVKETGQHITNLSEYTVILFTSCLGQQPALIQITVDAVYFA